MRSTRRGLLVGAAGLGLGAAVGAGSERLAGGAAAGATAGESIPFYGSHQAGIATPTQGYLQFAALDFVGESLPELRSLLQRWSQAVARMSVGRPIGVLGSGDVAPVDTGEGLGLGPARLTVTFGFGPRLFGDRHSGRLGLAGFRPPALVDLPAFATDALDPELCGGDLGVQVCADDPQVAFHALHEVIRLANPVAVARWGLAGFGRTANSRSQATPRNLMGFKDGTANVTGEDRVALDRFVWASARESPRWMHGGTYMVVRRIQMMLGAWDATSLADQEATFGRHKVSGAPLGAFHEHDPIDLDARSGGLPVIPERAHVRLASPAYHGGERLLRRGYSFSDGVDRTTTSAAGGLFFVCFQRDPRRQFIPIQHGLAEADALNRHIEHVGSAIFACPPGAGDGGFIGEGLLS